MNAPSREDLIESCLQELIISPYFEGTDEAALVLFATELVDDEIAFEFLLSDDEILMVKHTLFKAEGFLRRGERHMGMAFFPDAGILRLEAKPLASAIRYMERHTFELHRRDISSGHQTCSCQPGKVRLVWQRDSNQLIYVH